MIRCEECDENKPAHFDPRESSLCEETLCHDCFIPEAEIAIEELQAELAKAEKGAKG